MKEKERNSSIELFRLVSMFLVLVVHADFWFLGRPDFSNGISLVDVSQTLIEAFSCVCVNCFIIISGYFGIHPKLRSLSQLFTQIFFIYIVTYLLSCLLGVGTLKVTALLDNALCFSKSNWFVQAYLMLMLFSPVINAFIEKVSKGTFLFFVILFFIAEFWLGTVRDCEYAGFADGYSFVHFALIYCMARAVNIHRAVFEKIKPYWWFLLYVCCSVIMAMLMVKGCIANYSNPVVIVSSFALFLFFNGFSFHSRLINWMGVSAFAVFLIHTREPVLSWFRATDIYLFNEYPYLLYLVTIFGIMVLIFIGSILFDKLRILIFTPLIELIDVKLNPIITKWIKKN